MASINFPNVSFDWLANLPATMEAANTLETRKRTLADLNAGDADSLIAKGTQLLRAGDTEMGLKLLTEGRNRKAIDMRSIQDQLYMDWFRGNKATPPPPPGEGGIDIPLVPPAGGSGEQPPLIGGRTIAPAFPPPPPTGAPASVGPRSEAPRLSPSEQILAAAEGGAPAPEAPLRQFAGPPSPPVAPEPPGISPLTVQGAQMPAAVTPQVAPPSAQVPLGAPPQEDARAEATRVGRILAGMPPKVMSSPEGRAYMAQFTSALSRAKVPENEISYQQERIRRAQEGLPDITRRDFENDKATVGERYGAMVKTYQTYQGKGEQAGTLADKLERMQTIMDNPRFAPGNPGYIDAARNYFGSMVDTFRAAGVPDNLLPSKETIKNITEPNALREAFTSLANQAVTSGLGGLSKSISDADRNFLASAFPALMQTKEGMQIIKDYLSEASKRARMEQTEAGKYARDKEARGTAWGMDAAVRDRMEKYGEENRLLINKDGTRTDLGKRIESEATKAAPPATPPATAAPPAASGLIPVKRGDKKLWYNPATGEETPR